MQSRLSDYVRWLKDYALTWNQDKRHPYDIDTRAAFLEDEAGHKSRAGILEMIELLQACRIDDTPDSYAHHSRIDTLRDWERSLSEKERHAVRRNIISIEKILHKMAS